MIFNSNRHWLMQIEKWCIIINIQSENRKFFMATLIRVILWKCIIGIHCTRYVKSMFIFNRRDWYFCWLPKLVLCVWKFEIINMSTWDPSTSKSKGNILQTNRKHFIRQRLVHIEWAFGAKLFGHPRLHPTISRCSCTCRSVWNDKGCFYCSRTWIGFE